MQSLVVVIFEDINRAEAFRLHCRTDQAASAVNCAKVVAVERDPEGKVHLQSTHTLAADGAVIGGAWGVLVGFIFLNPLAGILAGAGIGAGIGELGDMGIGKDFVKRLGEHLRPGTSALFIPVPTEDVENVETLLRSTGGIVLSTGLTAQDEKDLEATLQKLAERAGRRAGKEQEATPPVSA